MNKKETSTYLLTVIFPGWDLGAEPSHPDKPRGRQNHKKRREASQDRSKRRESSQERGRRRDGSLDRIKTARKKRRPWEGSELYKQFETFAKFGDREADGTHINLSQSDRWLRQVRRHRFWGPTRIL